MNKLGQLIRNFRFKPKKTTIQERPVQMNVSNIPILIDITDIYQLIGDDLLDTNNMYNYLYTLLWKDKRHDIMDNIICTFYFEIPESQIFDMCTLLSKESFKIHATKENNIVKVLLQGSINQFRNYISNTDPSNCEDIYRIIISSIYFTHHIYFEDMINHGVLNANRFNTILKQKDCISKEIYNNGLYQYRLVDSIDIFELHKITNINYSELFRFIYVILEKQYELHKDCILNHTNQDGLELVNFVFKDNEKLVSVLVDKKPKYQLEEKDDYIDLSIDEVVEENTETITDILLDENASEIIRDFYSNGGGNIYEETDYKEV